MRALLTKRVDIAWLLLATALSGAALVLWLSLQPASPPAASVYIVRAAATSVAGRGGAPPEQPVVAVSPTEPELKATAAAQGSPTAAPAPTEVQAASPAPTSESSPTAIAPAQAPTPSIEAETTQPVPAPVQSAPDARIDINSATAEDLETLPGIGPVLAKRIVQDREANGPFHTVDDLDRVKGIGEGILAKVRDHVTAGP